MDYALKTRAIINLNVETWLLFAPYQNFWLRAWVSWKRPGFVQVIFNVDIEELNHQTSLDHCKPQRSFHQR